jgi:acyl-CoA thioesterase YciA
MSTNRSNRVAAYLCMTKDIGVGGNLFGGTMMAWMDEAAAIFAHQYTGVVRMVTLRYTELLFKEPVRVGDIVDIFADNPRIGRTSITFELEGRVDERVVFQTTATFVAVDGEGKPEAIPPRA